MISTVLKKLGSFARFYIISMRPYYFFVTGIAGWVGVAYYEYLSAQGQHQLPELSIEKKILILILLFLSWGVNQIINDFLGLEEDRINAPKRPMVTGDLPAIPAVLVSAVIMIGASVITYLFLSPVAVIFIWVGSLFNVIYNYSKAWGIWANIFFGVMIAITPIFGFYACSPLAPAFYATALPYLFAMVIVLNGLLTFYTYFKDYSGDQAAGQKTLVVQLGIQKSRPLALIFSIVPAIAFLMIQFSAHFPLHTTFYILAGATVLLHGITGIQFFRYPQGPKTRSNLLFNFQAGVAGQAALISIFAPIPGIIVFVLSISLIALLFLSHRDSK